MSLKSSHNAEKESLLRLVDSLEKVKTPAQFAEVLNSYIGWGRPDPIPRILSAMKEYLSEKPVVENKAN